MKHRVQVTGGFLWDVTFLGSERHSRAHSITYEKIWVELKKNASCSKKKPVRHEGKGGESRKDAKEQGWDGCVPRTVKTALRVLIFAWWSERHDQGI